MHNFLEYSIFKKKKKLKKSVFVSIEHLLRILKKTFTRLRIWANPNKMFTNTNYFAYNSTGQNLVPKFLHRTFIKPVQSQHRTAHNKNKPCYLN